MIGRFLSMTSRTLYSIMVIVLMGILSYDLINVEHVYLIILCTPVCARMVDGMVGGSWC